MWPALIPCLSNYRLCNVLFTRYILRLLRNISIVKRHRFDLYLANWLPRVVTLNVKENGVSRHLYKNAKQIKMLQLVQLCPCYTKTTTKQLLKSIFCVRRKLCIRPNDMSVNVVRVVCKHISKSMLLFWRELKWRQ